MIQYPQRTVEGNFLVSSARPEISVQIDTSLQYAGNLKSTVEDKAYIDNYFFVEKDDNGGIERIVYLQFQVSLPDAEETLYPELTKNIRMGERDFAYNGGVRPYRQARIDAQTKATDIRQSVNFLNEQGIHFRELEFYGALQFLNLADDEQGEKLFIVYLERLQEADIPEDVVVNSRESDDWSTFCETFLARAMRSFTVCD